MSDEPTELEPQTQALSNRALVGPWFLEVSGQGGAQQKLLEPGCTLTIGASRACTLQLSDPAVSARHLLVHVGEHGVELRDLDSTNGTYLGAVRVHRATLTRPESIVVLGRTTLAFYPKPRPEDLEPAPPIDGLIGNSPPMRRLRRELARFGSKRGNIVLQGESGCGKEVVARAVHRLSGRTGDFVAQNASCLPESLADSTLFGHRKGAFTGAVSDRAGVFEAANGGTLFLDEVADLPLLVQAKLLRVVEEGSVRPVGAVHSIKLDVRLVSACWAPLGERVSQGAFRADLFYRLATTVIEIPPLRERRTDIADLCAALLERRRSELGEKRLGSDALALLTEYGWPGNVRELDNVLYAASVRAASEVIRARDVALPKVQRVESRPLGKARSLDFEALLDQNSGNLSAAARAAGLPRSTFRARLLRRAHADAGGKAP